MRKNRWFHRSRQLLPQFRRAGHLAVAGGLIFWGLLNCGCDTQPQAGSAPPPVTADNQIDSQQNSQILNEPSVVTLTMGDESTLKSWIQEHHGDVILVDFWATWCAPCVAQFPHTVALAKQYGKQGLTTISVSMDEPDQQEQVRKFLTAQQACFLNLLTPYGAGSQFPDAFEIRGDVPVYKLYDRQGKLRYIFSEQPEGLPNGEPLSQLDKRLAELLAETAQ